MDEANLDLIFFSLSDKTRRGILSHLSKNESTFGELAQKFTSSKQAISKHVSILEKAGFIKKEKNGRVCHCSFNPRPLNKVLNTVKDYKIYWEKQLGNLESFLDQL